MKDAANNGGVTMNAITLAQHDNRGMEITTEIRLLRADCLAMSMRAGITDGSWTVGADRAFNDGAARICKRFRLTNKLWHAFCNISFPPYLCAFL
jgi:hypothetical protein